MCLADPDSVLLFFFCFFLPSFAVFFFWTVGTHCFCFYHWNLLYSFYFWYCLSVMKATGVYICLVAMRFVCELDRVYERRKKKNSIESNVSVYAVPLL